MGKPSSSTSGRVAGGGGVGGWDWTVGERRCLEIGGGAASSSLLEGEEDRAGSGTDADGLVVPAAAEEGGCLELR